MYKGRNEITIKLIAPNLNPKRSTLNAQLKHNKLLVLEALCCTFQVSNVSRF